MDNHEDSKSIQLPLVASLTTSSGLEWASGISPLEWLGEHLVEVIDKRQQFRAEILHRRETATTDDLSHNHPKHDFDLIEPRTVLGRVHEPDAIALLRQELLPALHRLQHASRSFLAQVVRGQKEAV